MMVLREHFSRDHRSRHSEWLRQREWFIKARQNQVSRERIADRLEDDMISMAADAVMATEIQLREFEARMDAFEARMDAFDDRLDAYDHAITQALIDNSERLALLKQQIAASDAVLSDMLATAHVMEDGRRVFKSEDGSTVIDEHGAQVAKDELDFDLVDGPTTAEDYRNARAKEKALSTEHDAVLEERHELHEAQAKVDAAREKSADARTSLNDARARIGEGGLSVKDIEDLDAELEEAMPGDLPTLPMAAAKHLTGTSDSIPAVKTEFSATANPVVNPDPAAVINDPRLQL